MKALAGMLLAFTLAVGIGSQADAKECSHKSASKHVAKTSSVKHHRSGLASAHSKKSSRAMCVCKAGPSRTKHIGRAGMMKSSSYGGYKSKRVNSAMPTPMESTDTMFNGNRRLNNDQNFNNGNQNINRNFNNGTRRSDSMINPNGIYDNNNLNNRNVDSLNSGSSGEFMDHGK